MIVDADAHVVETEHTWEFMEPADRKYRPTPMYPTSKEFGFWYCDGKLRRRVQHAVTSGELKALSQKMGRNVEVPDAALRMEDIPARLRHMDELGIDIQVLHATIFIEEVANRADVEIAICKGWNRWLADIWKQGKGRLVWSCVLPLKTMDAAIEELKFCRANGAVSVFLRAIEGERLLTDPYFHPLYQAASDLDMAMTVHVGNGNEANCELLGRHSGDAGNFWKLRANMAGACHGIIASDVMKEFPKLRYGFLESSSQWVPFVLNDLRKRIGHKRKLADNILKDHRIWVACETSDDLPFVLKYAGEDNLVIGTDYGHSDQSSEIEAIMNLKKKGDIAASIADKMIGANPQALYGL